MQSWPWVVTPRRSDFPTAIRGSVKKIILTITGFRALEQLSDGNFKFRWALQQKKEVFQEKNYKKKTTFYRFFRGVHLQI